MKRTIKLVAMLMALLMIMVSCAAPEASDQPEQPGNKAPDMVSVTFQNLEAKTTTVSSGTVDSVAIASVYFQYKAVNVEGLKQGEVTEWTDLSARPGLNTVIKLGRGIWHMYLRGFATADARTTAGTAETSDTTAIFAGEIEAFSAGNGSSALTANADVPLEFTNAIGKGSCEIEVTFDEAYASVEGKKVNVRIVCGTTDETKTLTFGENGTEASDTAVFENVDNGIATITVDYLDADGTPFGDSGTATTLIMTDMTTKTSATISMDVVKLTVVGSKPAGSAEDYFVPKVFNSIFDIYPDNLPDGVVVVGYAEETKAIEQIPITYPYVSQGYAQKDEKGRYTASSLGLVPITTNRYGIASYGASEVWCGNNFKSDWGASENTNLQTVKFVDEVTKIGFYAFQKCRNLTKVIIPEGVEVIDSYAFTGCTALTDINIPNTITSICLDAFSGCKSLESIILPESVTSLAGQTFTGCTNLKTIELGSITSIGLNTFSGCSSLTSITIPNSVTSIDSNAFGACTSLKSISIPDGVTFIGSSAFGGCTSLESISIPDSVTSIEGAVFSGCSKLTSITIPDGVTSIGNRMFNNCASLESISIPDSVTSIGSSAFEGCSGLTSVTIPNGVTSIDESAFRGCSSLSTISLGENIETIGEKAFENCTNLSQINYVGTEDEWTGSVPDTFFNSSKYDIVCNGERLLFRTSYDGDNKILKSGTAFAKTLATISIPEDYSIIGDRAFYNFSNLESITFSNNVTSIGSYAFSNCTNLTEVVIPGNVTEIKNGAFYDCSNLENVTLEEGIKTIGSSVFNYTKVKTLNLPSTLETGSFLGFYYHITSTMGSVNSYDRVTFNGTVEEWERKNIQVCEYNDVECIDGKPIFIVTTTNDGVTFKTRPCGKEQTSLTIPNGVTTIPNRAFYEFSLLEEITIPDSVNSIGEYAFYRCSSLKNISIPNGTSVNGNRTFYQCTNLENIDFLDGFNEIGDCMFFYCNNLTSVKLAENVTQIESDAFSNCTKLSEINIPDSVTSIGSYAFDSCSKLTSLILPSGLTRIGDGAFRWNGLKNVYINMPENDTLLSRSQLYSSCKIHWNSTGPKSV